MNILMLLAYCYPEQFSSSHLFDDLIEAFEQAGFKTIVYAPSPCRGIDEYTRKQYKNKKIEYRNNNSLEIHRFSMYKEGTNPFGRAFRYLISNVIQLFKGLNEENIDLLYSSSTPPTQGLLYGFLKVLLSKKDGKQIPFIYNVQDVFPDSLVSTGLTTEGSLVWKIGRIIENYTYSKADQIIVISSDIKKNLLKKGVAIEKIQLIPNWVDISDIQPVPKNANSLYEELGLSNDKFYVVYAGNLGKAQGIDDLLFAANAMSNNKDIMFLIFGSGSEQETVFEKSKKLTNIKCFPLMPNDRVSEVYSLGDLCFVGCTAGSGIGAVPSKTYSIMATQTPILLSFDRDTELWNLVKHNNCGYCSVPNDHSSLVNNINDAFLYSEDLKAKGINAYNCVRENYSKEKCTSQYVHLFKQLSSKD